jgi:hypothetical protein
MMGLYFNSFEHRIEGRFLGHSAECPSDRTRKLVEIMLYNGCSVQNGAWSKAKVAQGRQHENWISGRRQWL